MPDKDLKKRTEGERFWMIRTHHRMTQAEAAREIGVSERRYNWIERDKVRSPKRPGPLPREGRLGLLCALARRRHGLSLRGTAKELGISHTELLSREKLGDKRLVGAWETKKYQF